MIRLGEMADALTDAGIPLISLKNVGGSIIALYQRELTAPEQTLATSIIDDQYYRTKRNRRSIWDIITQLNALTSGQKSAIWNDLSSGTPMKYKLHKGLNASGIATIDLILAVSGLTGANLTNARLRLASMYVQDNPRYLVNPPFDPTINVLGDEEA